MLVAIGVCVALYFFIKWMIRSTANDVKELHQNGYSYMIPVCIIGGIVYGGTPIGLFDMMTAVFTIMLFTETAKGSCRIFSAIIFPLVYYLLHIEPLHGNAFFSFLLAFCLWAVALVIDILNEDESETTAVVSDKLE